MIISFNGGGGAGADGKSAYQIAVDNGFVGTEEEWLASLKGEKVKLQKKDYSITENGTTAIAPDAEFDGIFTGDINVNVQPKLQEKTVEIKANAAYEYTPDEGFYGISKLNVNAQIESTGSALNVSGTGWENGEATFPVSLARAATLEDDLNYTRQKFSEWDPSGTNAKELYRDNKTLVYAPKIDTSNVTNMDRCFNGCSNLTAVPLFDTSKVTDLIDCFNDCSSLTSIPQLDIGNVTNMDRCFNGCKKLTSVPQFDTSKVTKMFRCFYGCSSLISIPQLNTSEVTSIGDCFGSCSNLTTLGGFKGLKVSLNLYHYGSLKKLTHQSLLNVIAVLGQADPNFEAQPKLTLGSTNLAKLTAEEIAVGTAKGWQIVA